MKKTKDNWVDEKMNGNYKQGAFEFFLIGVCIACSFFITLTPTVSAALYYANPSESIQAVVDAASDGDTIIVRDGTYIENIDVDKRLTIQSKNGSAATIVHASNIHDNIFEVTADSVNISGFTVEGASWNCGIRIFDANNCNIANNVVSGNYHGIYLDGSNNNTLRNNNASFNNDTGIYLLSRSDNNAITGNSVTSNSGTGIELSVLSDFNLIVDNTIADNDGEAICLQYESNHNRIERNTISNNYKGVCIGYNGSSSYNVVSDNVISATRTTRFFGAISVHGNATTNNIIQNNTVLDNTFGILLKNSRYNRVMNNNASDNSYGIYLSSSLNNIIQNNIANSNAQTGISLYDSSTNNVVIYNNASFNKLKGIYLHSSDYNTFSFNHANSNREFGIQSYLSSNNTIINNIVGFNEYKGIYLHLSSNNTVTNNNAVFNSWDGIAVSESDHNDISNNNASFNKLRGIYLYSSDSNRITANYVKSNRTDRFRILIGSQGIGLHSSSNNTIENNNASFNTYGISLYSSDNNTITCNQENSNHFGIDLGSSSNNIIKNNDAHSNFWHGICVGRSSDYNQISNNNASSNGNFGVHLHSSSCNIVSNNDLFSNLYGLYLSAFGGNTSDNQIRNNNISRSKSYGVILDDLWLFNNITNNNASNNNLFGIFVHNSTSQTIRNNMANSNERGIGLQKSQYIKLINNVANRNKITGLSLINSTGNLLLNNSAGFNTYEGIYLSNSCANNISNNRVSSGYFGISLYSSNDNNIINNVAESNYYFKVFNYSSTGNNIVNFTQDEIHNQTEMTHGVKLYVLDAVTPSLQAVENATNATYSIVAENLGNVPDTFELVPSSADNPEILSLDKYNVSLGAGDISARVSARNVETIKLNVSDTTPGIYTVNVATYSRNDNTVRDMIETRTIVPGQVDSELINSPRITKSAIINSSINNSSINSSAILNSSISDSTIKCSVITNSEVVNTYLNDVIVEDAKIANGNILSGNITINEVVYEISTKTTISELIIGSDHRNSDLVGIKNITLELNTQNSNTRFNIRAESDYFAASMSVQKSSVPPQGIPEFTNNVGGYVYANASANLVNSTGWLNMSLFYDQTELGALDESTLRLRYFNESACSWEDLPVSDINLTGNYVWCNITHYSVFALLAQPAAAPSGGAYGSSSGPHRRPEEVIIPIANQGMNIFNFEWLSLDIIEVRTDLEGMAINARVGLKEVKKPVEITDPLGIVYGYFEIATNLKSENIKSASINFRVSKSWIDDNEIVTINMYQYNEDWEELKTETVKEDNNYFYYTTETPGLSIFVITGEKEAVEFTPPATTPTPTALSTTSPVPSTIPTATPVPTAIPASAPPAMVSMIELLIIAVIIASAMIVLVALLRGRKKK